MVNNQILHKYKEFLKTFIAFKSVSADPQHANDIESTARWLQDQLSLNNFKTEFITGYDNPLVFGHHVVDPKLPTILIYGHYDVQPALVEDGWNSNPFKLTEEDGRLFGRGIVDNKGQIAIYLSVIFELIKQKRLSYNIKFLIEGNEETGSDNLSKFVYDYSDLLSCDYILISDGEITGNHPVIEVGFRGVINASLSISTSNIDLHSGLYGGSAPNSALELAKFVQKIYRDNSSIAIDHFYDDVVPPTNMELENHSSFPFSAENHFRVTGTRKLILENNLDFYTQTGLRPSIEITGFDSGYTGVGFKNAIPHSAKVKLNIRLVPNQKTQKIKKLLEKFVKDNLPDYVDYSLEIGEGVIPIRIDPKSPLAQKAKKILENTFNKPVLTKYCSASIPIVVAFDQILKVAQVLIPFGNEDCNMHGANENFAIELIKKDIQVTIDLLS